MNRWNIARIEATTAITVTISSTDHKNGVAGKYFNFNAPSGWTPDQAVEVKQCRNGQAIWSGRIKWWNHKNGGSTGNSNGRRDSGASSGQWQVGDTATDGICQGGPQTKTPTTTTERLWVPTEKPGKNKRGEVCARKLARNKNKKNVGKIKKGRACARKLAENRKNL